MESTATTSSAGKANPPSPAVAIGPLASLRHEHWMWMLVAIFFAAKLPTLGLPYHWDEAGAYLPAALWLSEVGLEHALPGLHPPNRFFGHPQGLYVGLAAAFQLFGHSITLTHLIAVSLGASCLLLTYRLASVVADERAGLLAVFLLATSPLFFAQSGMMHGDMPVALLGLVVLWCHLTGRLKGYWLSAAALLYFKETGVAFVVAVVVHHLYSAGSNRFARESIRHALLLAAPLVVIVLFFASQWVTADRLVTNEYFRENALFNASLGEFIGVARWIFQKQGRWILTAAIAVAAMAYRSRYWRPDFTLFSLLIAFFWAAFTALYHLARYTLPVFPLLSIMAAAALLLLSQRWRWVSRVAIAGVSAFFIAHLLLATDRRGSHEYNMEYSDVVRVHQEAIRFLEDEYKAESVFTRFPMSTYLRNPDLGYVGTPLNVVSDPTRASIIASSAQGVSVDDVLEGRRARGKLQLVRRFEHRNKVVEIYQ